MVNQELSEAAVEFLAVVDNSDEEIVNKIPRGFLKFLQNIKSSTYKFEYDNTKKLMDQNIKPKTRGLIALVYQNYICNEEEKRTYIKICNEYLKNEEEQKNKLYSTNVFQKSNTNEVKCEGNKKELMVVNSKEGIFRKIVNKLKAIFNK